MLSQLTQQALGHDDSNIKRKGGAGVAEILSEIVFGEGG